MEGWLRRQASHASEGGCVFHAPTTPPPEAPAAHADLIEARTERAAERLRELHEAGEIDWTDVSPLAAYKMAFMDE
ncbi:MAG: hypothetical protein WBQ75_12620 [Acetobacteraceae bacterium]